MIPQSHLTAKAPYELKPVQHRRSSTPHKRSPKPGRHKDENSSTCDLQEQTASSVKNSSESSHICDKNSNSLTKEQSHSDIKDSDLLYSRTANLTSRSNVKDTPEQKQQTESKGPLHGISFKSKSSLAKTDYPSRGELSLRSSFNSKKQNVSLDGSSIQESRSNESTPDSSPKLTRPLKFTPGSLEHTSAKRYSSYDSTNFKIAAAENSDDDEIMV